MIRWLREWWMLVRAEAWKTVAVILAVSIGYWGVLSSVNRRAPPALADKPERLILPTIEHSTEACRWWLVRWVDTEYREAHCFSEAEVAAVMAWLRGEGTE